MNFDKIKAILNENIVFAKGLFLKSKNQNPRFNKYLDIHGLIYLCEKVYNFGYEQGVLDTLQGKVDKESIKMDTV